MFDHQTDELRRLRPGPLLDEYTVGKAFFDRLGMYLPELRANANKALSVVEIDLSHTLF